MLGCATSSLGIMHKLWDFCMTAWQVTHWLRTMVLAMLAHRVLIIEFSGVLIECTRIIGTRDCPTSVFNCTHIWLVNRRDVIHILRSFDIQFVFSVWFGDWYSSLLYVLNGVARNLLPGKCTCNQTLMLTTDSAVSNRSINISVKISNNIALVHRTDVLIVTGTLLPIVILDYDSLISGQVPLRILFGAQ